MALGAFGQLVAQYNSSLPTISDADYAVLSVDVNGRAFVVNSGTFAVQESGAALTSLQLIDNLVLIEDSAHVSGDSGVMPLAVRQDTLATLAGTDGDYAPISVNASGALYIVSTGTTAISGTVTADQGAPNTVANGWPVKITDGTDTVAVNADGSLNITDNGGSITVDNGGTFVVQVNGAALTSLQLIDDIVKIEDAAHVSGDSGVMALVIRKDAAGTLAGTDGDYAPLQVDANGALRVTGTFVAAVDDVFESGTAADAASDSGSGGDGLITTNNATFTDLVSVAVGAGTTFYVLGINGTCDKDAEIRLEVRDGATLVNTHRVFVVSGGAPTASMTFPRAIEITGAATRTVKLVAKNTQGASANASGAINGYTR